jgi:hypothetical protein
MNLNDSTFIGPFKEWVMGIFFPQKKAFWILTMPLGVALSLMVIAIVPVFVAGGMAWGTVWLSHDDMVGKRKFDLITK